MNLYAKESLKRDKIDKQSEQISLCVECLSTIWHICLVTVSIFENERFAIAMFSFRMSKMMVLSFNDLTVVAICANRTANFSVLSRSEVEMRVYAHSSLLMALSTKISKLSSKN